MENSPARATERASLHEYSVYIVHHEKGKHMVNAQIAVINASTLVSDQEAQEAMQALQTQIHRDVAPAWGVDADLTFVSGTSQMPPANMWWLVLLDNPDQAVAHGYHDLTTQGLPLSKVFVGLDKQTGYQWTVTASHELLEMLVDPDINISASFQRRADGPLFYAYEICDPCQAEQSGYHIDNTRVSNFVYPAWFETFHQPNSTQFDQCDMIERPFGLLPGGYCYVLDIKSGLGWHQLAAEEELHKYDRRPRPGSRRERRRTPRDQWVISKVKIPALAVAH
jgi:hypothetical protein